MSAPTVAIKCGLCQSKSIQKQEDGKKREVTQFVLGTNANNVGPLPVIIFFCGTCGAVFSVQIVDLKKEEEKGRIHLA